ncbi:hypothetical protein SAMN04489710_1049 [Paracidovorax konjaci]|uniref:Uncharacterized protein n=1 Tax=Paracidovorax konjaci TaxID=32040 RepID=A0A1I1TSN4_9BURK|nr:hypothetical protein SAMN04489710_1049 [Paracidovorax konjaci]
MKLRHAKVAARITNGLHLGMRCRIATLTNAIDTTANHMPMGIDDESRERNATVMNMGDGVGHRFLHALCERLSAFSQRHATAPPCAPLSLALSASFSQTTPPMMTASQNAWASVTA